MDPVEKKPFIGGGDKPRKPEKKPHEAKTERVMQKRMREEADATSTSKTAKDLHGSPIGAAQAAASSSTSKGLKNLPGGVLQMIAGRLLPKDQASLRSTDTQLRRETTTQIFREESARLNQFLTYFRERMPNIQLPDFAFSGNLATLNDELYDYADNEFIPAMIKALATLDQKSLEDLDLQDYDTQLPVGFKDIVPVERAYEALVARGPYRDPNECFMLLREIGGQPELQRAVEVAYSHVDNIRDPLHRNESLCTIATWDLEEFLMDELGISVMPPNMGRQMLRDPHTKIPAKLELIRNKFEKIHQNTERITAPAIQLRVRSQIAFYEALIYQCGGLKEEFKECYQRARLLYHDVEVVNGQNLTSDEQFHEQWIQVAVIAGLYDEAREMAETLDPVLREGILNDIATTEIDNTMQQIAVFLSDEITIRPQREWEVVIEMAQKLDVVALQELHAALIPRLNEIQDPALRLRVAQAFMLPQ